MGLLASACGMLAGGCSWIFVVPPPTDPPVTEATTAAPCTSSRAAPIADTVFAAYFGPLAPGGLALLILGARALATDADDGGGDTAADAALGAGLLTSGIVGLLIGVSLTTVFGLSATDGYDDAAACREWMERTDPGPPPP
jgi:hypothetical protein